MATMGGMSRTSVLFVMFQLIYLVAAQEVVKRVPQGFVGMRGKKFTDADSAQIEHFFKRKPQFFVGVKGKKSFLSNLDEDPTYKRAPMGFVGMRGKKDSLEDIDYDNYNHLPRTAGSLIGQIDYATNEDVDNLDSALVLRDLLKQYILKHSNSEEALSDVNFTNEVDKRAAGIHHFFGVRGKKSEPNKRPYDLTFRGKFIGVRGKKDINSDRLQEIQYLVEGAPWPKKKNQMGFIGMRGKKWNENEDELSSEATTTN